VLKQHYNCENNELAEVSVFRYKVQPFYVHVETLMSHAIQNQQTGGTEVLNRIPIEVGESGSGQVHLRQAEAARANI
jgi:hypothetical protein